MKLIIGLGNPDKIYQNTRHNLGQKILLEYLKKLNLNNLSLKKKLAAQILETGQGTDKNIFAISTEYMNHSGITVQKLSQFFKIKPNDIYVLHDDLDLKVGDYKIQFNRGSAGHNGIKSIIEKLGTQQFHRIRIGIDNPKNHIPTEDYVLQPFSIKDLNIINSITSRIFDEISKIINNSSGS